jgi:hypothetical protein
MKKALENLRLWVWTADFAWRLVEFAVVVAGGTTAALLAASSQLLQAMGPLAWFGIGLVAALLVSLVFYLVAAARRATANATLLSALASKPSPVNPLLNSFEDKVIPMASLYLPGRQLHRHKLFRRCKFVGPGVVALLGGNFSQSRFIGAGHVLTIPDNTMLTAITVFENCTIEDCEFFQVALIIPRTAAQNFAQQLPGVQVAL